MAGEWRCRLCHSPLREGAYMVMPSNLNGVRGVCISCVDRLIDKYHTKYLHDLVPLFLKQERESSPLKALQQEVRELRALLAEVTDPNK